MLTREIIKKFLEREHCEVIDDDLIDYAIGLSQGLGEFELYEDMLNAKEFINNVDSCYYNLGLMARYGIDFR